MLPVVAEHCARPGWLNRADPKGRCRIFDFVKFTHGKATIRFFFNGIRDIYSESSHPRRAEYGEKCCRKLAALKSNFVWSTFVLQNDAGESREDSHVCSRGPAHVENHGGGIFSPIQHSERSFISRASMNGCRPSGPPPIEHPGRAQPSSRTGDHCTLGYRFVEKV